MAENMNAANQGAAVSIDTSTNEGVQFSGAPASVNFEGTAPVQVNDVQEAPSVSPAPSVPVAPSAPIGTTESLVSNIVEDNISGSRFQPQNISQPQSSAASRSSQPQQNTQQHQPQSQRSLQNSNIRSVGNQVLSTQLASPSTTGTANTQTASTVGNVVSSAMAAAGMSTPSTAMRQPAMHQGSNLIPGTTTRATQAGAGDAFSQTAAQPQFRDNSLGKANEVEKMEQGSASQQRFPNAPVLPKDRRSVERTNQQQYADRRRMIGDSILGREEVRQQGVVAKTEPVNTVSYANRRFKKAKKFLKDKINNRIKHSVSYSGTSFYETIVSDDMVMPNYASIGSENLIDSLREPNSTLLQIVNDKRAENGEEPLDLEFCLNNISVLVNAINNLNIEVTLEKTPVNVKNSIQVRTLRAHYGRGVRLHPTQTKAYNADYDGDPAVLNLDQRNIRSYSRAMTMLIDAEGNPTIDPDFFPLDPITLQQRNKVIDAMKESYFAWQPDIVNQIIGVYADACNEPSNDNWVALLRKIDEVAGRNLREGEYRGDVSSLILKSLYDFSTNRRGLSLATQFEEMVEHSNYNPPQANLDPFVYKLVDLVDEIVAGRPAPNFQDFTRFYNKYYGDVKGKKNVPFRLVADFAKAINRTDLINVGSNIFGIKPIRTDTAGIYQDAREANREVTINELWQFTCAAGTSKMISGRMRMGSRQLAVSTQIKTMVAKQCPVPRYDFNNNIPVDQQFRNWINAFIGIYNRNMRLLEASKISYRQGMIPVREEAKYTGIDERTFKGLAKALIEVYGDKTVETLFPTTILGYSRRKRNGEYIGDNTNTGVVYSYRNMSIENFSANNRISFTGEHRKNQNGEDIVIPRFEVINKHVSNGTFTPMDILMLVADRRSSQIGDYNEAWLKATKDNMGVLSKIQKNIAENNFNEYTTNMLEFMHLMSPDMFDFFGMDSPITFANSKWGKKLIGSQNLSEFRSHLLSMTIEYRFNKSSKIQQEIKDIEGDRTRDIDKMDSLDAAFELEMESLGSSSMVWDTIVKESMEGNRTFLALVRDGGIDGWESHAKDFWKRQDRDKYHTLLTFLKSSESYETKVAVLADVTRVRQRYADINTDEIMAQLAHHPDRLHAGPRFDMDSGIRSEIDTLKESSNRISSYREKSIDNIKKESQRILKEAVKDRAAFEQRLRRFSDDPGYMVHVDTILAADAIASIYDKTYDDSEKIKQQAVVNGYFGALSLQRSGGYYTHLQQTDNAVVNAIGFDQLTVLDIARILGNPDIEMRVYDEFGIPAIVSRETLCGGTSIDDVIKYLEKNPRICLACRRFIAGVGSDVDGTARMTAINSMDAGDTITSQVFSLLNDRPRFLAIAALCTPANNNVGRNLAEEIHDNLENLCNFIAAESVGDKTVMEIYRDASKFLGVSVDKIERMMASGSFDIDPDLYEYFAAGGNLYSEVMREIAEAISVVQNANLDVANIPDTHNMSIDESSVVSYYDARQQLSGARTATMIGIEGAETKKNLVLKEYLKNRPDRFMMSVDGQVIPVPQDEVPMDLTLERNPRNQISSICKFLEVKREKGAETFNAKSKKFGDDGTNSIIKFIKMGTRSMFDRYGKRRGETWAIEDAQDLLDSIANCTNKDEAIPILAQALIDADARLGYTDGVQFVESDYWNRADLMLAENEDGSLSIRTLEQLATACANRLSDEAVESENEETIVAELEQIVATTGTTADPMTITAEEVAHRCLYNVQTHSSIGNRFRIDRALRQRSSSTERNYTLMLKIFRDFDSDRMPDGTVYVPSSRDVVENNSRIKLNRLRKELRNRIKELANPDYQVGSYDYLGTSKDSDIDSLLSPGPQNLILFQGSKEDVDNRRLIEQCERYGITAAFENIYDVPVDYLDDVIITGNGLCLLPFFDMRLNGSMSKPIMPAPGQIPFNPDNIMVNVEDTTYEFKEGDATYHMTRELADRARVYFQGDDQVFDVYRLFPNVLQSYPDSDFQMDFCTNEEIQAFIANGEFDPKEMTINGFNQAVVDIGVLPGNENFDREAARFNIRLKEFQEAFDPQSADADGMLTGNVRYDSIVGFVKIVIDGNAVALAPIWPFHLEESGSVPTTFKVEKVEFDHESHSFNLTWGYSGSLDGQYIKAFEGIGASNKMIANSDRARSRNLDNGLAVDGFYSTKSVASRLFASNKRIHTMISLIMMPRVDKNYSYNFAEDSGSFPGDPTIERNGEQVSIKQLLLSGDMGITDWIKVQEMNIEYHVDPEINSLVKFWVDRCIDFGTVNPTILLATKTNQGVMWPIATEFECFMDTSHNFQNAFMKFMHTMQPTLCPESIDGDSTTTLFKPVTTDRSEDYGVLQMLVPHYDDQGKEYKVPENVYLSFGFFGEEFSGFKKVNFNAFEHSIDSLNVANNMNGFNLSQMMSFGRSGMSSIKKGANTLHVIPEKVVDDPYQIKKKAAEERFEQLHGLTDKIIDSEEYGKVLALTGHRPNFDKRTGKSKLWGWDMSDPHYRKVMDELADYCKKNGIDTIISGMALGFDQLGARVAIENNLKLIAAIPMKNQGEGAGWKRESLEEYYDILQYADRIFLVSDGDFKNNGRKKMQDRNEFMVNNADEVFALYDGTPGGTANAVNYAKKVNKPVHQLNPRNIEVNFSGEDESNELDSYIEKWDKDFLDANFDEDDLFELNRDIETLEQINNSDRVGEILEWLESVSNELYSWLQEPHERDFKHVKDDIYETLETSFAPGYYDNNTVVTEKYRYKPLSNDEIESLNLYEYGEFYRRIGLSEAEKARRRAQEERLREIDEYNRKLKEKREKFIGPIRPTEIL